ncbi:MAG: SMC-Scp complex subunit ScpB [Nanoarchaeota archaeon]|nr:SMC-Scp complex subunit ScpB [Nanoarchaeota archaeon]
MQDKKNKIEVILFTTGKFMGLQEIADFCGIGSVGTVKELLEQLKKDYEEKQGPLSIFEEKGKYKLTIRKQYNYLTTKLLDVTEMDKPTQGTLAIIAYKQPAIQAEVIKIRGNKAYDHISSLKELSFVTSEKYGRTRLIKLTQKFFDYFDLVEDHLKEKFSNMAKLEKETKELEKELDEDEPQETEAKKKSSKKSEETEKAPEPAPMPEPSPEKPWAGSEKEEVPTPEPAPEPITPEPLNKSDEEPEESSKSKSKKKEKSAQE